MQWCHAIYGYSLAVEVVEPLQKKVDEATAKQDKAMAIVKVKQDELDKIMS